MNTNRKTAIIAGILFIIATAAGLLGTAFIGSILDAPDYLIKIFVNQNQVTIGVLFKIYRGCDKCWYRNCAVSDYEEVECRSGPWICWLQGPGGGLLYGRRRQPAVLADIQSGICKAQELRISHRFKSSAL